MLINRRTLLQGAAALSILPVGKSFADDAAPLRIGLMCIKTGPLAAAGIQMEQGISLFLKERSNVIAGRPTKLFVADTGGNASAAKSKIRELVERDNVDFVLGPLAAFEASAIREYLLEHKMPNMCLAATEDLSQRTPSPYFMRLTGSSAITAHPLAEYAVKTLKFKRIVTVADDFDFGYGQVSGFQRVFEDNGGKIVMKLWTPLGVADYAPYISRIKNVDAVFMGFAGSNSLRFIRQCNEFGLKYQLLGGQAIVDEPWLQQMGDPAIGMITGCEYTSEVNTPSNKRLIAEMRKTYNAELGLYAVIMYASGQFIEAALRATKGKTSDKAELMKALRAVSIDDTPCGALKVDEFGNAIRNVYVCQVKRVNGRLVNTIIKTYPNVGQFWTYDPKWFLAQPVYSRDYPPARYLEE